VLAYADPIPHAPEPAPLRARLPVRHWSLTLARVDAFACSAITDAFVAEIVRLHRQRLGNVLARGAAVSLVAWPRAPARRSRIHALVVDGVFVGSPLTLLPVCDPPSRRQLRSVARRLGGCHVRSIAHTLVTGPALSPGASAGARGVRCRLSHALADGTTHAIVSAAQMATCLRLRVDSARLRDPVLCHGVLS